MKAYTDYFSKIFREPFYHVVDEKFGFISSVDNGWLKAYVTHEFFNKEKNIKLYFYMEAVINDSQETLPMKRFYVTAYPYSLINGEKIKIIQSGSIKAIQMQALTDPTVYFPTTRMKKIASGEVKPRATSSRTDVLKYVEKKYNAATKKTNKNSIAYMYMRCGKDKDMIVCVIRSTVSKVNMYFVYRLYGDNNGKVIYENKKARYFYDNPIKEIDTLMNLLKDANEEQAEKIIKEKY